MRAMHRRVPASRPSPWKSRLVLALMAAVLASASPALAEGPGERLSIATARVLEVLRDQGLPEPGKPDERRNRIRGIVNEMFDWQEIGRRVLASNSDALTAVERDQFTALFADVLQRSYIAMIHAYRGEEIAMRLVDESLEGQRAAVQAEIVARSSVVHLTYRCIEHEDGWKIYDVAIDGVSIMGNSRAQISHLTRRFGYGGMMKLLKLKQSQLAMEDYDRGATITRVGPVQ